jgi:hypothetical protein
MTVVLWRRFVEEYIIGKIRGRVAQDPRLLQVRGLGRRPRDRRGRGRRGRSGWTPRDEWAWPRRCGGESC